MPTSRRLFAITTLLLLMTSCGSDHTATTVRSVWARASADGQTTGALYFTIRGGSDADVLERVTVDTAVAASTSLHETVEVGHQDGHKKTAGMADDMPGMEHEGTMTMQAVDQLEIAAGATVTAKPGGIHVMLESLAAPLTAGQTFTVRFTFKQAGSVTATATVRS